MRQRKKNRWIRMLCCILLFALCAQAVSAAVLTTALRTDTMEIGTGLSYGENNYRTGSAYETEHYLIYEGNTALVPQVYYGNTMYGRSTLDKMTDLLAADGKTAVAAVNGSFFALATGEPVGPVVTDGALRCSGKGYAVGFFADGTAKIGEPEFTVQCSFGSFSAEINYNKVLTKSNGIVLYTQDYDYKTKNTLTAWNVVIAPEEDSVPVSGTLRAKVVSASEAASADIPDGCMLLSMANETLYHSTLLTLQQLSAGDEIRITVSCADGWENVVSACGGGDLLLRDGVVQSAFTLNGADSRDSRTAAGVRKDGTLILYTVDGAQEGRSSGLTLAELAERMKELGCVTALNLDGGSSTICGIRYPGEDSLTTVSLLTEGTQRACANFIYFTMDTQPAGTASRLFLYPHASYALSGARISYRAAATDRNYLAAEVPSGLRYSASGGEMTSDGIFTVGSGPTATVTASVRGMSASATVTVVSEPTSVVVCRDGKTVSGQTVSVRLGEEVDFNTLAYYEGQSVSASDESFVWTVSGDIGTVSSDGVFTQSGSGSSGTLQVRCGKAETTVTITVPEMDKDAPEIVLSASGTVLRATVTDALSGVASLSLTADDEPLSYTWDGKTLQAEIPAETTIIKLTAADRMENRAGACLETGYTSGNVFSDMTNSWACKYVNYLYERGVMLGTVDAQGNRTYSPNASITRQAFITALIRWLGVDTTLYDGTVLPFADEGEIAPYALPYLRAAYALGYLNGSERDGRLYANPKATITRQEAMAILGRSQAGGYAEDDLSSFSDAGEVKAYAKSYIAQMVTRGVISGSGGKLNPHGTLTRAQVAKMLYYLTL